MLKFCALSSGSSGNCYYIASEETGILIDAGISCTQIKKSLLHIGETLDGVKAVFVTHEHSDHVTGLRVLLKKYPISLYLTEGTYSGIRGISDYYTLEPITRFQTGESIRIGDLTVHSYKVSHDAKEPVCYKVSADGGENVGIITDLGWADPEVIRAFEDCDLLLLESNHDVELLKIGPYQPFLKKRILSRQGHLSNDSAGVIARNIISKGRLKYLVLGHLSETNNHVDLAYETVRQSIRESGYVSGEDYELEVSVRHQVGKLYRIKRILAVLLFIAMAFTQSLLPVFADELLLREQVTYDLPVLNVIVVRDGKTLEFVGRRLDSGVLEDYDAPFEVGSLARVTTSFALLELMRRRGISADEKIDLYLPHTIDSSLCEGIRFRDLFTHSTGYRNNRFATLSAQPYSESIRNRALRYLEDGERRFHPGEFSLLSNADFAFMTLLIEALSGQSFDSYMTEFFRANKMQNTQVERSASTPDRPSLMPRFRTVAGQLAEAGDYYALIPAADSLVSTLADMEKLLKILTDSGLPKEYNLFSRTFTNINEKTAKSFVFNYFDYNDTAIYLLDSSLPGSTNRLIFVPEKRIGIFIGFNTDRLEARERITNSILEHLGIYAAPLENRYILSDGAGKFEGYYSPVNISGKNVETFVSFSHQIKISGIDDGILIGEDFFRPISELVYYSEQSQKYAGFTTDEAGRLGYLVLDNELYERSFSSNIQLILLFALMTISALLLILTVSKWDRLIAGRVDDRPRVWVLFAQIIALISLGLTIFAVRETGYWDIAYGGGFAISALRYVGWCVPASLVLILCALACTRGDYKWSGFFRILNMASVPLLVFYLYWLLNYRFLPFF